MLRFLKDCPRVVSLSPSEYTSAVSKKLMPPSIEALTSSSAPFWSTAPMTLYNPSPPPKIMVPKERRETRSPVLPRVLYSIFVLSLREALLLECCHVYHKATLALFFVIRSDDSALLFLGHVY